MNEKKQTINKNSYINEFDLIRDIKDKVKLTHSSNIKGIGDDAAIFKNGDIYLASSTDMLTEGIHFDLTYTPLKHLGYKCVVSNLSDIVAMNMMPKSILISIAVSSKLNHQNIMEFYEGVFLACKNYNIDLIGGDTTSSLTGFTISATVFGEIKDSKKIIYRDAAKDGDIIFVTGNLGSSYLGLQILEREKKIFLEHPGTQPNLGEYDYIVGKQLKPEARTDIISFFSDNNIIPTSMIDISDGLSSELLHICKSSDVGCEVYTKKIPINNESVRVAQELGINEVTAALNGGEDYELLFTVNPKDLSKLLNENFSSLGVIKKKKEGCKIIMEDDTKHELISMGWENKL